MRAYTLNLYRFKMGGKFFAHFECSVDAKVFGIHNAEVPLASSLPKVSLSRRGTGCEFSICHLHEHVCLPAFDTAAERDVYTKRVARAVADVCEGAGWVLHVNKKGAPHVLQV